MTIYTVRAADGYEVHMKLLHGEDCREHQVGFIHEMEPIRKSASDEITS